MSLPGQPLICLVQIEESALELRIVSRPHDGANLRPCLHPKFEPMPAHENRFGRAGLNLQLSRFRQKVRYHLRCTRWLGRAAHGVSRHDQTQARNVLRFEPPFLASVVELVQEFLDLLRQISLELEQLLDRLGFALGLGGPGLFAIAFLDSSFLSLPQINDVLVVLMVTQHKAWMPYYALMATGGSIAGCYVIYYLAEKGGETFLRKRLHQGNIDRALRMYQRHGLMALMVPAILPPPAPFKLFVLMAGLAEVRPHQFVLAIALARGARYVALGTLAIFYGDAALELMRTRGREVAIWMAALLAASGIGWWVWQRRLRSVH